MSFASASPHPTHPGSFFSKKTIRTSRVVKSVEMFGLFMNQKKRVRQGPNSDCNGTPDSITGEASGVVCF